MDGIEESRRRIREEKKRKTGTLDLNGLGLTELPKELSDLTHLKVLDIGLNNRPNNARVMKVLSRLTTLSNSQSLNFWGTQGTQVADLSPLAKLPNLQSLNFWGTQVADLSPLANLPNLQSLNFWGTPVVDLSPLANLRRLQDLNCSGTQVADLSPLCNLSSLQDLNCSDTQVVDLSPLCNVSCLQDLNCSDTEVADLSPLASLSSLQDLDCTRTQILDLSPLANLPSLQDLDCTGTQVADLSPLANLSSLQSLSLWGTQVADLSPLANLSSLQDLNCSDTQVVDLSPLANLSSLQDFNCSATQVVDLSSLANLPNLQTLNLGGTQVADVSPLANLSSLQSLDCSDTQVVDLSPLANLSSLQSLDCSDTQVADVSPLANLPSLQSLNCSETQVADLVPLIHLKKISDLHANACRLSDFPRCLISKLTRLFLHETSIPGIPGEILSHESYEDCLPRLRAHLADLDSGLVEVRRAKLIVIGNGQVGKTQLCRQLQGLSFDPTIPSTHGICVSNVPIAGLGPGAALNLWDFGGQDIYHGTHALFMRTRALFLIVWHPDFEQPGEVTSEGSKFRNYPLSYWLDYVRTLGQSHSPVIVVQSRCDRPELEAKRLPADTDGFEFLKPCWHSAKAGRGLAALSEAIRDGVQYLRDREGVSVMGKGRMRVIEVLEGWRKEDARLPRDERLHRTLTRSRFQQLCENSGGVSSPDNLLDFLHQLGVVFYQPNLFLDSIILDQSWALEAVYAVFEREKSHRQIASMVGRFTRSFLDMTVWGEYTPREQDLFLSLMQSAGVCFLRRKADEMMGLEAEYVAPDLLPEKRAVAGQLAGRWNDVKCPRIEFTYPFLHTGLMRGLICDAGEVAGEDGVYWKYGVWVYDSDSGAHALIEQKNTGEHGGSIVASIQQGRPERLARWIRERFAEQNRRFGYPDLAPSIDELPRVGEKGDGGLAREATVETTSGDGTGHGARKRHAMLAAPMPSDPAFGPLPPTSFPRKGSEVYISYAWGDQTEEGQRRGAVVDSICRALAAKNVKVHRDAADLDSGDRIKEFMNRIVDGDVIVTVLSDKYLRSPACMYELFGIYRRCGDRPDQFLDRIIPVVLPDAKISRLVDRLGYANFWKRQKEELEAALRELGFGYAGGEAPKEFRLMGEFARNVADMLTYLNDKLFPRDIKQMESSGFAEIIRLIDKRGKR